MKCFQTRESIIRERIEELFIKIYKLGPSIRTDWPNTEHEYNCIFRAINRMFKLMYPKK